MRKRSVIFLFILVASARSADESSKDFQVTKENVTTFYNGFKRVTAYPHYVAPRTAFLCRTPSPEMIEEEKRATGLHYKASVLIYANPLAEDVITRGADQFPPGAIVIKEKLAADGAVSGVGGMIKRPAGFNLEHGDWEYFYQAHDADFSSGRLQNCIDCHASAKSLDYTFRNWQSANGKLGQFIQGLPRSKIAAPVPKP